MSINDSDTKERTAVELGYCARSMFEMASQLKISGHEGHETLIDLGKKMAEQASKLLDHLPEEQ
jgi:hypothetical protein